MTQISPASLRAFGEYPFHIFKSLRHYTRVRYRGLLKNTCQLFALCTLTGIFSLRHRLAAAKSQARESPDDF